MGIRTAAVLTAAAIAATALAGCSSSSTETPSDSATMVGGMTECTNEAVSGEIDTALKASGSGLVSLDSLQCADGWAVADITAGANEDDAIGDVMVLQAEGQFWVPVDRVAVCGTVEGAATAMPSDATIPASLFAAGCSTD